MSNLHEECGIFGIFSENRQNVAETVYYGLFALQHRGQESCGIVVNDDGIFRDYKDNGLAHEVFTRHVLENLGPGNMAIGHDRYSTTGANERINAQPIVVNHHKGRMALAHNGNIVNAFELRQELELQGSIFHTTNDSEVIAYVITKERIQSESIEAAVNKAMGRIDGAYSLLIMSPQKMIACRDPYGFRPLCYGKREDGTYIVASETCALDAVGAEYIRDLEPGEILVFSKDGIRSIRDHCGEKEHKICIFEYLYFARPDSQIEERAFTKHGEKPAPCWPCSIRWMRISSSAFRIPVWMRPSATRSNPEFRTEWVLSRTSTSAEPSSPRVRRIGKIRFASS